MLKEFSLSFYGCSCASVQTDKTRIICDPWFDTAAYEGTWVPDLDVSNWVRRIGDCNGIYISHIHPDHYDPKSLFNYFKVYGEKKIFIPFFKNLKNVDRNWLKKKMVADGINPNLIKQSKDGSFRLNDFNLHIIPSDTNSFSDIDSGIIIFNEKSKYSLTNLNDFGFSEKLMKKFQFQIKKKKLKNIATLYNYMSSGSWPHTHYSCNDLNISLKKSLEKQKKEFINRYKSVHEIIDSKIHLPFAAGAKYIGPLAKYEKFRPKTSVKRILNLDKKAVYLKPFAKKIDLIQIDQNIKRINNFRPRIITENSTKNKKKFDFYDYEKKFKGLDYNERILGKLFEASKKRAFNRNEVKDKHILKIYALPDWENFNDLMLKNKITNKEKFLIGDIKFNLESADKIDKVHKTDIYLHYKALFGVLTGVVHWNNLELGSHKIVRRYPEVFNKEIVDFMNFFSLA